MVGMSSSWSQVRAAVAEAQWEDVLVRLTGVPRIPQDIAYVLARESHDHPEFQQILLTLDAVQDCVLNAVDPEQTGRWNSMSLLRHFASPFAGWMDAPAYAIRSRIATRRQKRALGTRESMALDREKAGEPPLPETVAEVWDRVLRDEGFLNVPRSQFHEWLYADVIRRFPEKIRRGSDTPAAPGLAKEAMRIICGWGDAHQRAELAHNPELALDLLLSLIDDPAEEVARACADNPQCTGDLANRLEARFPDLGDVLDRLPGADVDRQLRVPAVECTEAIVRTFLGAVLATPEEGEELRARLAAGAETGAAAEAGAAGEAGAAAQAGAVTLGSAWFDIAWQASESRLAFD